MTAEPRNRRLSNSRYSPSKNHKQLTQKLFSSTATRLGEVDNVGLNTVTEDSVTLPYSESRIALVANLCHKKPMTSSLTIRDSFHR